MPQISFTLNGKKQTVDLADPDMPLLWVLRDVLNLTGTKFGCGIAQCGVCTVHVDGVAVKSCVTPAATVAGRKIVTIEGMPNHPLQKAWIEEEVPQCGYCQSGMIMTAAGLLASNPNPSDKEIDDALKFNICRCGTYQRIRRAVRRAAKGGHK